MSSNKREMSSKLELGWSIVIFDKFIRFVGCLKTTKNIFCSGREINRHVHISKSSNQRGTNNFRTDKTQEHGGAGQNVM